MRSAVTICLVPEARRGPFVFHAGEFAAGEPPGLTGPTSALERGLEACCRLAADLGFDAVEIFPAGGGAEAFPGAFLRDLLGDLGLGLAAVGTGAGWIRHGLHLCHADAGIRARARAFIAEVIDAAGRLGAPAILGSMQGRTGEGVDREAALDHLAAALDELGARAAGHGQPLLYEPLNRYETDLFNRQEEAAAFLRTRLSSGATVRLLCDLFHMQIEEADPAATLVACGELVGHVHWADSNRRAVGFGHADMPRVVAALRRIGYRGHLSAEVFPLPTPLEAARQSVESVRSLVAV
ncbi:MAG: sugar phosphate isomerase/epimerase [Planctomycetia bacterium]|nr:sugar phosphate isomerase/epimerase [Planctomycetia bacterium]